MNKMQLWLRDYERSRHSKQPNESWVSSKYDTQLPWKVLQQTYIPSLHMNWGQCCSALKRSWKAYEIAGRNGEPRRDIAWRIRNIQTQMGIEKSDFPELEGMETDDEESGGDWSLNFGTSEETSEYTDEWSEQDKQLRREEREAEQENDDWWFS
jgi:hypothetical protein